MAFSEHQLNPALVAVFVSLLYALWQSIIVLTVAYDRDLRKVPGPFLSRFTQLPLKVAVLSGRRTVYIHALHEGYGSFVRIAPREVAIADIDAWRKIHRIGSDFNKGPWYQGQTPTQHNDETCGVFGIRNNKTASRRRRILQSACTRKIVHEWESRIVELAELTVGKIKGELKSGRSDVMKWWTFMTSDVLADLAFGVPFNNVQNGERCQLVRDIEAIMPLIGLRTEMPWIARLVELFAEPWTRYNQYGREAIEHTKFAKKGGHPTLFSKMVSEDGSEAMTPDQVIEQEAANMIIAGTDTTAMSLTYLTFSVLKDKNVHTRLVKECETCPEYPGYEQLESLPYLNNVVQETLRLYPPIPGSLPRIVPEGGENLSGYIIPAGTQVDTQAWTFHHDPKVFQDPLKFEPDRWINPTPAMKEHFMAFGCPARTCLGQHIARHEMLHAVFKLFRECPDIKLASSATEQSMEIVDFFTTKPKGGTCEIVLA